MPGSTVGASLEVIFELPAEQRFGPPRCVCWESTWHRLSDDVGHA